DDFRQGKKTRSGATSEKNCLFYFRFSIFDFRSLQLQRKSNCDHCCQNFARPVKWKPLVLSSTNEPVCASSNLRCVRRPPTHSDNASSIQARGNPGRGSIVALTVTLKSFFSMRAQTSARELVAWTCDTFLSRSSRRNPSAKRACRKKIAPGTRLVCCARSSSKLCASAGLARHSASITIASGKNSSDGASCSIVRFKRALEFNSQTNGTTGKLRRFISSSSHS